MIKLKLPRSLQMDYEPYNELNIVHKSNNFSNIIIIYTDGSLKNGLRGYGVYYKYPNNQHLNVTNDNDDDLNDALYKFVGHSNDINYVELLSVSSAIDHLLIDTHINLSLYSYIHIITDNIQVFYWLSGDNKIEEPHVYHKIMDYYKTINKLKDEFNINAKIQWCQGHI